MAPDPTHTPAQEVGARVGRIEKRLDALVADLASNTPAKTIAARQVELAALLAELDAA